MIAATPLARLGTDRVVLAVSVLLVIVALAFPVVAFLQPQPQDVTVEEIMAGGVEHPDGWVRLRGRVVPLADSPTGEPGDHGLLVDEANPLRAIVVRAEDSPAAEASTAVTGHVAPANVIVAEDLPIEATVAGTPPRIVGNTVVDLDAEPLPPRSVFWPLVFGLLSLAGVIALGRQSGYPIFRPSREIDVLVRPLQPGERVPAAVAGRLGQHRFDLEEPSEALLLAGHGERGSVLTVQLLPSGSRPPPPVSVGNGWTRGRIGYVHTISETVPALHVRSEIADAILLFARVGERDRAAALISLDR
jgi:hypothetical protein